MARHTHTRDRPQNSDKKQAPRAAFRAPLLNGALELQIMSPHLAVPAHRSGTPTPGTASDQFRFRYLQMPAFFFDDGAGSTSGSSLEVSVSGSMQVCLLLDTAVRFNY